MILVTGGTGFIGRVLVQRLVEMGKPVRLLLRPGKITASLPKSIPVEVAVSSLTDERGLQSALKGVDTIIHLAGSEHAGTQADLEGVDIQGTQTLVNAAMHVGIDRILFLSHLGVDRFSAYPVLKAKAIAEGHIQHSGIPYTIFRSAVVFGPGDHFTTTFSQAIKVAPGFFLLPGGGINLLQPLWVEDLVTCMALVLMEKSDSNQVYTIGGSETFSFREIILQLMDKKRIRKRLVSIDPPYLRWLTLTLAGRRRFPISIYWLDYLASDRTCPLDSLPRQFGLIPTRFVKSLSYL